MSNIKKCFTSRWGAQGKIMEADFSQLEVIVLAYLSRDPQLIADIKNGTDVHSVNAEKLFGKNFTPAQRKLAKAMSFQLQYGSGYKNMAKTNNVSEATAKQFIENYYNRYPQVKLWQQGNIEAVEASRKPSDYRTPSGIPAGIGTLNSVTKRRYKFIETDGFRGTLSFSPTQIKNYPVQGLATADIVPAVLGKLYYVLKKDKELYKKALLINTVHDSIVLDVHESVVDKAAKTVKHVMESAPKIMNARFGIDFDLPLPVEVSIGQNWLHQQKLDLN